MEKFQMDVLFQRYPILQECKEDIYNVVNIWKECYLHSGKILLCGNGGSCADCDHIVGELMKGFLLKRNLGKEEIGKISSVGVDDAEQFASSLQGSLPAISLPSQTALISAFANDVNADFVYAQLVNGYACKNDVLVCISTSGNSKNCVNAAIMGKAKGIKVVSLTGKKESKLSGLSDVTIRVPSTETYQVQELHLPVYHAICAEIENFFFKQ